MGKRFLFDNSRSKNELGLKYTDFNKTVLDCAYDAIKFGFVDDKINN